MKSTTYSVHKYKYIYVNHGNYVTEIRKVNSTSIPQNRVKQRFGNPCSGD